MPDKSIVFVLGAGASKPYGFPLGKELLYDVVGELTSNRDVFAHLIKSGASRDNLERFAKSLHRSNLPSVDLFLESRPEFVDIGKAAIAAILVPRERDEALIRHATKSEWYEHLFTRLHTTSKEEFPRVPLTVITFNYDRSFERAMEIAIENCYGVSPGEAVELRKRIPVIHPYGTLGALPDEHSKYPGDLEWRAYSPELNLTSGRIAASGIRIVSEGREDTPAIIEAQRAISQATDVAFLGFSYHRDNVHRLGFPLEQSRARLEGSCCGMTAVEQQHAKNLFDTKYVSLKLHAESEECLGFIRNLDCI